MVLLNQSPRARVVIGRCSCRCWALESGEDSLHHVPKCAQSPLSWQFSIVSMISTKRTPCSRADAPSHIARHNSCDRHAPRHTPSGAGFHAERAVSSRERAGHGGQGPDRWPSETPSGARATAHPPVSALPSEFVSGLPPPDAPRHCWHAPVPPNVTKISLSHSVLVRRLYFL